MTRAQKAFANHAGGHPQRWLGGTLNELSNGMPAALLHCHHHLRPFKQDSMPPSTCESNCVNGCCPKALEATIHGHTTGSKSFRSLFSCCSGQLSLTPSPSPSLFFSTLHPKSQKPRGREITVGDLPSERFTAIKLKSNFKLRLISKSAATRRPNGLLSYGR